MSTTIRNKTEERVMLRLNSGRTWYLGPREEIELEAVETKGNSWLDKLEARHIIDIAPEEGDRTADEEDE